MKNIKIICCIFLVLLSSCERKNEKVPRARKGVIDFSGWNFREMGITKLEGEWEFYWQELLTYEDFKNDPDKKAGYYIRPGNFWNDLEIENTKISNFGYATIRLKVRGLHATEPLGFYLKHAAVNYTLWLNDREIAYNGVVGVNRESSKPLRFKTCESFVFPPGEEFMLIMQISNYHEFGGGPTREIHVGIKKDIDKYFLLINIRDWVVFTILFIMGMYHLVFFCFKNSLKNFFYFGLFCLLLSIRLLDMNFMLHVIFRDTRLYVPFSRMDFLATFFLVPVFLYYYKHQFSLSIKRYMSIFFWGMAICLSISLFVLPHWISATYTILLFQGYVAFGSFYFVFQFIYSVIKGKKYHSLAFFSSSLLVITVINDSLNLLNIIQTDDYINYGVFLFIIFQSLYNARVYTETLNNYEKLSVTLEKKVASRTRKLKKEKELKIRFFINLTHEIKTPLTIIAGYIDKQICRHGRTSEMVVIQEHTAKLSEDVINFMDLESLERGRSLYDHNKIINFTIILERKIELFEELAVKKGISFTSALDHTLFVKMDPNAVDRIINNLLDNAIKYTEKGGLVHVSLVKGKEFSLLSVKDTGIGIKKKYRKLIFEPYYRITQKEDNFRGAGMGLNIVRNIIEEVGGAITVKSESGKGTEFIITLRPCQCDEETSLKYQRASPLLKSVKSAGDFDLTQPVTGDSLFQLHESSFSKTKKNILIVEDNRKILAYLGENLYATYNVYYACDGLEGLERLQSIPRPDLIISDIMMSPMDGYGFFEELRKEEKYFSIPFIFLTARGGLEEKLKGLKTGAIDFIPKPFRIEELKARIASILRLCDALTDEAITRVVQKARIHLEGPDPGETTDGDISLDTHLKILYEKYRISRREIQVISLLSKGYEYKEIAGHLSISINTIRTYVRRIYGKLKIQNRIELFGIFGNPLLSSAN